MYTKSMVNNKSFEWRIQRKVAPREHVGRRVQQRWRAAAPAVAIAATSSSYRAATWFVCAANYVVCSSIATVNVFSNSK